MPFKETNASTEERATVALSAEEKEKLDRENYYFSQKAAREEFEKLSLNREEAKEWFNAKYGAYGDVAITLRDQNGQPIGEKKFSEISDSEKQSHSYGLLNLIWENYNLEFIKHFYNEPELLKVADKQLNNLPRLVNLYRENQEKLEQN